MVPRAQKSLLSADETSPLTDKEAIWKRWAEHFDGILNWPSSINDETINRLPQVECNLLLDEFPTISETVNAIKLLSSGKAPGSDAIPADIYKAGGVQAAEKLTELFHIMWRKEAIPQEFKDASIIHLFKVMLTIRRRLITPFILGSMSVGLNILICHSFTDL